MIASPSVMPTIINILFKSFDLYLGHRQQLDRDRRDDVSKICRRHEQHQRRRAEVRLRPHKVRFMLMFFIESSD